MNRIPMTPYTQYNDNELLQLLSAGNSEAFDALYNRYWEELYRSAYWVIKDHDVCKDLVQDVFVWLWEKRQTLHITSLRPYLKAAVKFKVANWLRKGSVKDNVYEELARRQIDTAPPTPEERVEAQEMNRIIREAIAQLPEKCREIYLLRRERKLSSQEISKLLGVSAKTVENQITIAQNRIRSSIGLSIFLFFFWG